jgi:hypothetical protein
LVPSGRNFWGPMRRAPPRWVRLSSLASSPSSTASREAAVRAADARQRAAVGELSSAQWGCCGSLRMLPS